MIISRKDGVSVDGGEISGGWGIDIRKHSNGGNV